MARPRRIPWAQRATELLSGIGLLLAAFASPVYAVPITDPVGDFLSTYTGPQVGDLDVVAAEVTLDGDRLLFSGTLNDAVGTTTGAVYVFGLDRGAGAPVFALTGTPLLTGSNVLFDSAVVLDPSGAANLFADLSTGMPVFTPLPPGAVMFSGNTVSADLPLSLFPSQGFAPRRYTFNLWPRSGLDASDNTQVSDFAPDNSNAGVTAVPEPSGLTFGAVSLLLLTARAWGRKPGRR